MIPSASWSAWVGVRPVAAAEIVVHEELIEVALNLLDADIPGRAARDAETLVEERAIHALNEAIGARRGA